MNEYAEKLKSPKWQKVRLQIFNRDIWTCQMCGDTETTLHVHHKCYVKDVDPWDYPIKYLITLCVNCHEAESSSFNENLNAVTQAIKERGFLSNEIFPLIHAFKCLPLLKDVSLQVGAITTMMHDISLTKRWMKKELKSMIPKKVDV